MMNPTQKTGTAQGKSQKMEGFLTPETPEHSPLTSPYPKFGQTSLEVHTYSKSVNSRVEGATFPGHIMGVVQPYKEWTQFSQEQASKGLSNDHLVYTAQLELFFFLENLGSELLVFSKNHCTLYGNYFCADI